MKYGVSLTLVWTTDVEADSPEEAANIATEEAPYDVESSVPAHVWDEETGENWDIE